MYHNKEVRRVTYTNVSIPNDLIEKVEGIVSGSKFGYRNRSEFIIEAVREKVHKESKEVEA
jgi:metal-responsive CopG/Arc/MetJ family transcriptional regulator